MTTQQIEYFIYTARSGSFTKTAERYYSTQPTVSRQIALLEEELGCRLLERHAKKLELTAAGEIMLEAMEKATEIVNKATERVALAERGLFGSLSVGVITGTDLNRFITAETKQFLDHNPKVEFSISLDSFSDLREKLECGEIDIAFVHSFELASFDKVKYKRIYKTEPVIVMAAEHPLAKKDAIVPGDFSDQTFAILRKAESQGRELDIVNNIEQRMGVSVEIRYVQNISTLLFYVETEGMLGALDSSMYIMDDPRYYCYYFDNDNSPEPVYLAAIWKKDNQSTVLSEYLNYFREA